MSRHSGPEGVAPDDQRCEALVKGHRSANYYAWTKVDRQCSRRANQMRSGICVCHIHARIKVLQHVPSNMTDRPLAAPGLTSYRFMGRYGWIMIGAKDTADAIREAGRSTDIATMDPYLEVWNGERYVAVEY